MAMDPVAASLRDHLEHCNALRHAAGSGAALDAARQQEQRSRQRS